MLSSKSDQEISWMLDDYGIKHGPVVGSTRLLYEKKLRDMMAKERKVKEASERIQFREQRSSLNEDVYIHQHGQRRYDASSSRGNAIFSTNDIVNEPMVTPYYTVSQGKYRLERTQEGTQNRTQDRTQCLGSEQFIPLWLKIVVFLTVVGILVFIFINMEPVQKEDFKQLT